MRIYWKIFAGFWFATFMMVSLAMLAGYLAGPSERDRSLPPRLLVRSLSGALSQGGIEALPAWFERHPALRTDSVVIVDEFDHAVYPDRLNRRVQHLISSIPGAAHRGVYQRFDGVYFLRRVEGPDGQSWRFLLRLPPTWLRPFRERPLLRYSTALLVSGIVCYLLALLFTRRLEYLSRTVKLLADGQLEARVDWASARGKGDEIQGLGRDFNQMADRLQQLVNGQEHLIKGVSHELRSPLARMQVLLALAHKKSGPAAWPELDRLQAEVERLGQIVADLLLLPRLEQRAELLDEVLDLVGLLDAVIEDKRALTPPMTQGIQWQNPADECLVNGRATLLYSVFANVLENAVRYAPGDSVIDVSLVCDGEQWVTTIRDRGPGVAQGDQQRIFEPFYRGSVARERATGGVGLGLAIAQRVVSAHGGSMEARNASPGLLVRVALPMRAAAD